ncbi:MAG TPA: AAA family ATPase, partial [Gaiellaceae bacterium]|nr:AAA family ATPase [Gaiellaceae bacterium]
PPLGADGIGTLESVLANSFDLPAPLAYELADEERELLRLTEQQYVVLDGLARHPRAAIAGCAGSGKTFLAAEKARRLAAQGFRVLVLAYNVLLARHLRRGLADVPEIDVFAFDGLCRELVREAGHDFPADPEAGEEGDYYRRLRALFAESAEVAAGRYGALVVDEAQDFDPDWWLPLQLLLENPDESPLYVFYDDNQRIFPVPQGLPVPGEPFLLSVNCRNTRRINELVRAFYEGGTIDARGPEGPPIEQHVYVSDEELLGQLDEAVRAWVGQAEVPPEAIALLSGHSQDRSVLWRVDRLGGVALTDDPWEQGKVFRSSIWRFKGLERLVVGVCELDGVPERALYVGFSRPSVFLSIFVPEKTRHRLPRLAA